MGKLRESGGDLVDSYDKLRIEAECQLDIRMKILEGLYTMQFMSIILCKNQGSIISLLQKRYHTFLEAICSLFPCSLLPTPKEREAQNVSSSRIGEEVDAACV